MRSTCFVPVIVCLLMFVAYNNAQAPICSDRCAVPLTTCSLVTYKVYTTNLTNITANEEDVQSVLDRIPANDTLCRTLVNQFACAITYPACNITQRPAVPQRPCVKLCTDFRASCLAYSSFFPASLTRYLNCSGVDTTGAPLYGNLSVVVNVTNGNVTTNVTTYTQCFALTNTRPQCNALRSGSCLKWNVTQAPRTGELCGPFISTTVYGAQAISATDAIAFTGAIQFIQPYFSILPLGCYKALMSFICGNFFPDCHLEYVPEFNQTLALPSKPCKSICDTRLALCADFFTDLNVTLSLACGTVPPGPIVNMTVSNTPDTNVPVQTTCRSEIIPINASAPYYLPPFDQCPVVLGRKNNPSEELNEPRCTLKCPDASYTASEWGVLVQLTRVGASLSLITMTFLLVSYLVHYDKRRFPLSIHIWEFVSCLFLALAFLLNGSAPEENVWCDDPGTFATQSSNSRCGAQGFLFIMFGLSVATWCCVIAFIMFRAIVFNKKVKDMESFTIYFHLFGWGVPLVFAITALATNSIGYGAPLAWCFIQFSGFGFGSTYSGISIDYYVFYIPIGVLFVIIIVMFWLTVAKIVQVRRLQVAKNSTRKKSSRTLQAQIRVLLFIFVVYIICFTIFEWRFQIEAENSRHNFDAIGFDWIVCKIKREVNNSTKFEFGNCPDDVPPARINYPHTGAESFLISAVGFFMFFAFGSDLGIYRHWKKLIILATQREWRQIVDFIRFGKDPFNPTSTGTKTKTSDSSNSSAVKNDDKPKRPPNGVARSDLSTTSVEEDTGTSTAPPAKTGGPQMYYLA